MTIDDAITSKKKYENDRERRKKAAINAILDNDFWGALIAINEASQSHAIVNEYDYILDLMKMGD